MENRISQEWVKREDANLRGDSAFSPRLDEVHAVAFPRPMGLISKEGAATVAAFSRDYLWRHIGKYCDRPPTKFIGSSKSDMLDTFCSVWNFMVIRVAERAAATMNNEQVREAVIARFGWVSKNVRQSFQTLGFQRKQARVYGAEAQSAHISGKSHA